MIFSEPQDELSRLLSTGFTYHSGVKTPAYTAKPRCHDDGPFSSLYLGGIGAGNFSRDLRGFFSKWHLQPGYHVDVTISQAVLFLRLEISDGKVLCFELNENSFSGDSEDLRRTVHVLFPFVREVYEIHSLQVRCIVDFYSPVIFSDLHAASAPVVNIELTVENLGDDEIDADAALFWPNLLGWRALQVTSCHRGGKLWPGQFSYGNTARRETALTEDTAAVLQERKSAGVNMSDMDGQVCIAASGGTRQSLEAMVRTEQNTVLKDPELQKYTFLWLKEYFCRKGLLPGNWDGWQSQPDEACCSAVSAGSKVESGNAQALSFVIAWDMPIIRFGSERRWYKRYCEYLDS
ncbi:MAG: GH116 family glycosyl-hydrolase, partial [Spirochaetia bacterium]